MKGSKLHEIEKHLFSRLLDLGLQLLGYYIYLVTKLVNERGKNLHNKGMRERSYFSVFGQLSIARTKYYCPSQKIRYELDATPGLPSGRYSCLLEDWMAYGAVEVDFEQSVGYLERILGHHLHGMQSSRCTYHLPGEVENFYQQKADPYDQDSTHLSVGFDGKGVPIIRSETERAQESVATRLSKGQK